MEVDVDKLFVISRLSSTKTDLDSSLTSFYSDFYFAFTSSLSFFVDFFSSSLCSPIGPMASKFNFLISSFISIQAGLAIARRKA